MRFLHLLISAVLLAAPACGAPMAHTLESTHFVFRYGADTEAWRVNDLRSSAEKSWIELRDRFGGWTPPGPRIPVYVYANRAEFNKATGAKGAEMVLGTASSGDRSIHIDVSETLQKPEGVMTHELLHVFVFGYMGNRVQTLPLWLHEGLASVAGGVPAIKAQTAVAEAETEGKLFALKDIAVEFPKGNERSSLAYLQGQDAANWLLDRGGWTEMRALLTRMRDGETFAEAMKAVYGMTPEAMEAGWRSSVRRHSRPFAWNNVFGLFFVGLMIGALAWGWSTVRRKWLRQIAEEEEVVVTPPPSWWPSDEEWRG